MPFELRDQAIFTVRSAKREEGRSYKINVNRQNLISWCRAFCKHPLCRKCKHPHMYEMPPDNYKTLLYENITKTYKKSTSLLENSINMEAKYIAKKIKLDDRIECLATTPAFITNWMIELNV